MRGWSTFVCDDHEGASNCCDEGKRVAELPAHFCPHQRRMKRLCRTENDATSASTQSCLLTPRGFFDAECQIEILIIFFGLRAVI